VGLEARVRDYSEDVLLVEIRSRQFIVMRSSMIEGLICLYINPRLTNGACICAALGCYDDGMI